MIKVNIFALGMMAALISFLGFIVENVWLALTKGCINNRNMNMPFLLGYGCLVIAMYLLIGTPGDMHWPFGRSLHMAKAEKCFWYFMISMMVVSVSELILGNLVEKLCGFEYWNYLWLPLHLTKYTSLPTSMAFAAMITFFMENCFYPVLAWIMKMDADRMRIISIVLMIIMTADFFVSFYDMYKKKDFHMKWRIVLTGKKPELEILK